MKRRTLALLVALGALLLAACDDPGLAAHRVKLHDGRHVECVTSDDAGFGSLTPSCDWGHAR